MGSPKNPQQDFLPNKTCRVVVKNIGSTANWSEFDPDINSHQLSDFEKVTRSLYALVP